MKTGVHQYEDKLLEFAYGELPASEADAVDAHVRGCTRCAQSLAQLQSVRATVRLLPVEPAPQAGLESLLAFAEQQARRNAAANAPVSWWRRLTSARLVASLGSVAALLTVGVVAWRANQGFAPDPALATLEVRDQLEEAAPSAAGVSDLQAPPAVALPLPETAKEEASVNQRGKDLDERLDEPVAAPKIAGSTEPLRKPSKVAYAPSGSGAIADGKSRQAAPSKAELKPDLAKNYSDAFRGGADLGRAEQAPPARESTGNEGDFDSTFGAKPSELPSSGFGLGTAGPKAEKQAKRDRVDAKKVRTDPVAATAPAPASPPADDAAPPPAPSKKKASVAQKEGSKASVAQNEGNKAAVAQNEGNKASVAQNEVSVAQNDENRASVTQSETKTAPVVSLGKSLKLPAYTKAPATRDAEDEARAPSQVVDKLGAADGANAARQSAERRKVALDQARAASQRNDRRAEVKFALVVIEQGASGSERVEALKRVCDAYEALGESDRADPYCDALVSEFPSSAAAEALSRRRGYQQRVAPAKSPSPKRAAEEVNKDSERSKKAVDPAAPASAY